MKINKVILSLTLILAVYTGKSQVTNTDTLTNAPMNSAANIMAGTNGKNVRLGTYAQIDYNQQFADTSSQNGKLDVHRLILFLGYQFNKRTTFVGELEFEHVKEVFVEQAFVNYNINPIVNFRAGLMLVPMGILNEYHEPTTFNGVERPNLEGTISPTTWREIGAGFAGKVDDLSLKYQLYIMNGFNGYDGAGKFRGSDGLRKGRQKGSESIMSSPVFTGKVDYYGLPGLKVGLSGYFGNSQSTAYNGLSKNDSEGRIRADSTVIGISMIGVDYRLNKKAFQSRGQLLYSQLDNTEQYNAITGKDLGASMFGYYLEVGYDFLKLIKKNSKQKIVVFTRYEKYNTQQSVAGVTTINDAYNRTDITSGISYKIANGVVLKGDYQYMLNAADEVKNFINFGVGIWF